MRTGVQTGRRDRDVTAYPAQKEILGDPPPLGRWGVGELPQWHFIHLQQGADINSDPKLAPLEERKITARGGGGGLVDTHPPQK